MKYQLTVPRMATDLAEKEEAFKFKLNALVKNQSFESEQALLDEVAKQIQFQNMSSSLVAFMGNKGVLKVNRKFTQKTIIELKPIINQ